MKLISTLKSIILEYKLVDRFTSMGGQSVDVEVNYHALISQKTQSTFSRVSIEEILESLSDVREIIVKQSNKILDSCDSKNKDCGLIVRDNSLGFDYHMWLKKTNSGKLKLIINTSIYHPKKLFNTDKSNIIVVDKEGNYNIIESFVSVKVNDKIIQYFLFD
jgi:hypothetical protein